MLDNMVEECLAEVGAESFTCYLSDKTENGFRYELYPEYKANRKQDKPKHYRALRNHLVSFWNAIITKGQEADDALSIDQVKYNADSKSGESSIIISIDKDLYQVPGHHYNFVTKQFNFVTEEQGVYWFYKQVLTGDPSDNTGGLKGIGPKKAEKILGEVGQTEEELFEKVYNAYVYAFDGIIDEAETALWITANLVGIRKKENEFWQIPKKIQLPITVETEPT